jgi:hypothetical protein
MFEVFFNWASREALVIDVEKNNYARYSYFLFPDPSPVQERLFCFYFTHFVTTTAQRDPERFRWGVQGELRKINLDAWAIMASLGSAPPPPLLPPPPQGRGTCEEEEEVSSPAPAPPPPTSA